MSRPNIILIICDQLRGDALSCSGNPTIDTPNIDYLASRGTRFRHAYSAVPSCLPARATLWSGQHQWHTGVLGMGRGQGPTPNDFPHTLPGELAAAGYRTHLVGKGHFSPHRASMGFQSQELDESGRTLITGFPDEYRTWFARHAPRHITPDDHGVYWNSWHARPWHTDESLHPTAWTMNRALDFLRTRTPEQPFFLNISFARPHSPYVPPRVYWERYHEAETPAPSIGDWCAMHDDPLTAADPNAWRGHMTPRQIHRARAGYYGEVSFIDTQIGRLLNYMSRFDREALRNTWFVFTSDHGDMLGDHYLWRKTYAYEGSAHIPLIVSPPLTGARAKTAVADQVVELRDIMPSLLEAADVPIPATVDGSSVLPIVNGASPSWRTHIHGEHCWCYSHEQEMHYVTDGLRKFVWLPRVGVEQFFNLEDDPGESVNRVDNPDARAEVEHWRNVLIAELAARDCGWVVNGALHCPEEPLVSPYKNVRWSGTP